MGVSSLPKTVTRQRLNCDVNPGLSVPESSMLTTQLPVSVVQGRNEREVYHLATIGAIPS